MYLRSRIAVFAFLIPVSLSAQTARKWELRGDTSGAPRGCSAEAGLDAIESWFAAMSNHDSTALARVMPTHFVFSTGRFTPNDPFFVAHSISELASYARQRGRHREQLLLKAITFNNWRGEGLEFGPVYFMRIADDLGSSPRPGIGKGEYRCKRGVAVLNLGPRPAGDDGRSDMRPPRRTH